MSQETDITTETPPTSRPAASESPFSTIEEAIEEIRRGKMVVVCDGEDRENEGDLVMAAQFATPEAVNFMAKEARGLICLALTPERCRKLGLNLMAAKNEAPLQTAFTVTIEAAGGVSTGISAHDRAHTIQVAIDPDSGPRDLVVPGHMFPLQAKEGGVLERTGHTEASVDLARLAGLIPAGVICEVMNDDGSMARVPDLIPYCAKHGLKMITVADLIAYRRRPRSWSNGWWRRRCRPPSATSPRSATARWSTTNTTSRWSKARSTGSRTCSSACTASASPATSSTACAATAASSSRPRWR